MFRILSQNHNSCRRSALHDVDVSPSECIIGIQECVFQNCVVKLRVTLKNKLIFFDLRTDGFRQVLASELGDEVPIGAMTITNTKNTVIRSLGIFYNGILILLLVQLALFFANLSFFDIIQLFNINLSPSFSLKLVVGKFFLNI